MVLISCCYSVSWLKNVHCIFCLPFPIPGSHSSTRFSFTSHINTCTWIFVSRSTSGGTQTKKAGSFQLNSKDLLRKVQKLTMFRSLFARREIFQMSNFKSSLGLWSSKINNYEGSSRKTIGDFFVFEKSVSEREKILEKYTCHSWLCWKSQSLLTSADQGTCPFFVLYVNKIYPASKWFYSWWLADLYSYTNTTCQWNEAGEMEKVWTESAGKIYGIILKTSN